MECCTNRKIYNAKKRAELFGIGKIQIKHNELSDYFEEWLYRKSVFVQSAKRSKFVKKGMVYSVRVAATIIDFFPRCKVATCRKEGKKGLVLELYIENLYRKDGIFDEEKK